MMTDFANKILPGTGRGTASEAGGGGAETVQHHSAGLAGGLSTPPSALRAATSPFRGVVK